MRCSPRTWFILIALACSAAPAASQTAQRSTIEGVILDPTGAVIVNARVTLSGPRVPGRCEDGDR